MIGTVYKIEVNKEIYIGSTIQKLFDRQATHNTLLRQNKEKYKLYEECRENNITKIKCILLEEKEIEDIDEIRMLEQEYITKLQPTLNSWSAYRTEEDKKEHSKEYQKDYYENNKEYKKEYYENNKDKELERNKKYYNENKEKVKESKRKYRDNNKEKISERQTEKIKCPICNKIVSRCNIAIHKKTNKCLSNKTI